MEALLVGIIELMKAIAAYGMLGLMCLLIFYVYYRIVWEVCAWIKNTLIPTIFGEDDAPRWD